MDSKELLGELVGFIKQASPELWRIAVRQVYVSVLKPSIAVFIFLIVSSGVFFMSTKYIKESASKFTDLEWDSLYDIGAALKVGSLLLLLISLIFVHDIVVRLLNPHYYAIQILTDFVK